MLVFLGLKPIAEDQFESQMDTLSLSGSESESESESELLSEKTFKHPKIFLTQTDFPTKVYSIHKAILPDFKPKSKLKWAIFFDGWRSFCSLNIFWN